jgi:hypothetical protein
MAVLGDEDRVLELRGPLAVLGHRGPPVRPDVVLDRAQREHRLDRERHAGFHHHVVVRVVVVRHHEPRMEGGTDPVPGEVPHHAVAETLGVRLDHPADGVQRASRRDGPDAAHHRLVRPLDQQPRLLVHLAGAERGVRIPVHASDEPGDVHVDDVAAGDQGVVGDAVADHLVQRGAQRLRVTAVAERGRVGAVADQEIVPDLVQVVRGDAWSDVPAHFLQCLRGDLASHPHARDRVGVLDVGLAEGGAFLADVLGAGDVRGDLPGGGQSARVEQSGHVLRV